MASADEQPTTQALSTCFVISEIGSQGSPERLRADKILEHVIRPAAAAA